MSLCYQYKLNVKAIRLEQTVIIKFVTAVFSKNIFFCGKMFLGIKYES